MAESVPLPVRGSVRDLLNDLLGRAVSVAKSAPQTLDAGRQAFAASYSLDDGSVAAVCICDRALAGSSGAAIGMVPATEAAEQMASAGVLQGDLYEFFREVVNVLAKLLNGPAMPHVRLHEVHPVPGLVPAEVAAVILSPSDRLDYEIAVDGYGSGTMTLLAG
jgi:hypothetical protein